MEISGVRMPVGGEHLPEPVVHLWLPLSVERNGQRVSLFPFEDEETLCGLPMAGGAVVDWRGWILCSRCCQEYGAHLARYFGAVPEFQAAARALGSVPRAVGRDRGCERRMTNVANQ